VLSLVWTESEQPTVETSRNTVRSSEQFSSSPPTLAHAAVGCALLENDGRIVSVTPTFATMLDTDVALLFGQNVCDLMMISDDDREPRDLLLDGQKKVVLLHNGRLLNWTADKIAPGAILGGYYIAIISEGSELESLERQVVHREKLAALGELTAQVAHEIAGPLNIIANNAELLLEEEGMPPSGLQGLTTMRDEAFRLCSTLQDILDFARDQRPQIKGHDAVKLVNRVLEPFKLHQSGKKISWRIDAEPGLPPVRGDAERLHQVFFNLFKNAWDASPDGGEVVIFVRSQRPEQATEGIEFVIVDKGEGIDPAHLKYVREPFFTTKPGGQGTGLGLAIVERILAAHQGSLKLASSQGDGTSVTVLLPVFRAQEAIVEDIEQLSFR